MEAGMIGHCIAHGLRTARRNPALVALLWLWTMTLAAVAAFPAWLWLGRGFDLAPESDHMLTGFSFVTLAELAQYDRSSVRGVLMSIVFAMIILAFLSNPLVSGGMLEALTANDENSALQRFTRGAGRYFWRFLRLLIYALITTAVFSGAFLAGFTPLSNKLANSTWEMASIVGGLFQAAGLAFILGVLMLALDFARVRLAAEEDRRALRSWFSSLGMVTRRLPATLPLLLVPVAIFALLGGTYLAYARFVPANTALLILTLIAIQQMVMFCRASLRVSVVSSVIEFQQGLRVSRGEAAPPGEASLFPATTEQERPAAKEPDTQDSNNPTGL
jgi:hypothetical protein